MQICKDKSREVQEEFAMIRMQGTPCWTCSSFGWSFCSFLDSPVLCLSSVLSHPLPWLRHCSVYILSRLMKHIQDGAFNYRRAGYLLCGLSSCRMEMVIALGSHLVSVMGKCGCCLAVNHHYGAQLWGQDWVYQDFDEPSLKWRCGHLTFNWVSRWSI